MRITDFYKQHYIIILCLVVVLDIAMFLMKYLDIINLRSIAFLGGFTAIVSIFEFKILKVKELAPRTEGALIATSVLCVIFFILSIITRGKNQSYIVLFFSTSTFFIVLLTFIKIFNVKGE
jgi:hypothetical protein